MAETESWKDVEITSSDTGWIVRGCPFPRKDWNMEVVFTRKVKPVKEGTIVVSDNPHVPLKLAERRIDGWWTIHSDDGKTGPWDGTVEEQDELARRCYAPIQGVEWGDD
jgi:hypothetical protein